LVGKCRINFYNLSKSQFFTLGSIVCADQIYRKDDAWSNFLKTFLTTSERTASSQISHELKRFLLDADIVYETVNDSCKSLSFLICSTLQRILQVLRSQLGRFHKSPFFRVFGGGAEDDGRVLLRPEDEGEAEDENDDAEAEEAAVQRRRSLQKYSA